MTLARELYLSILVDRGTSRITIMASTEGGVNIEDVAAETPEKIVFQSIDPSTGIQGYHCRNVAFALGLEGWAGQILHQTSYGSLQSVSRNGRINARD